MACGRVNECCVLTSKCISCSHWVSVTDDAMVGNDDDEEDDDDVYG